MAPGFDGQVYLLEDRVPHDAHTHTFEGDGKTSTGVTPGSPRARQVLKALKIIDLRPPTPPEGCPTTM